MSDATCTSDWQELHVETGFYPPVTYLLIDDLHIRRMEGVQRALCEPQKHPEPVVQAQKPWEGEGVWMHNGWLYDRDEKVFKLWYHCHDPSFYDEYPDLGWNYRRAYAVSADARTWEKPELGVVQWQGSTRNNLVDFPPAGGDGPNANVFKNPGDGDPNRRYMSLSSERHPREPGEKAITWPGGPDPKDDPNGRGFYLCDSPDGFTWTRQPRPIMSHALCMDGPTVHGFDEDLNAWILWWRPRIGPKFRTMGISIARDLEKIPYPQMALVPDDEDAPGTEFDRCASIKVSGGYVALVRTLFPEYNRRESEGFSAHPLPTGFQPGCTHMESAGRSPVHVDRRRTGHLGRTAHHTGKPDPGRRRHLHSVSSGSRRDAAWDRIGHTQTRSLGSDRTGPHPWGVENPPDQLGRSSAAYQRQRHWRFDSCRASGCCRQTRSRLHDGRLRSG